MEKENKFQTRIPDFLIMLLDKGTKIAFNQYEGKKNAETGPEYSMGKKMYRTQISKYCCRKDTGTQQAAELDLFDCLVHDAIFTLWLENEKTFTITTILKLMSGRTKVKPSKGMEKEVKESIERMISTLINVNYTDEAKCYLKKDFDDRRMYTYSGSLISGEIITETVNNNFSDAAVRINAEPILGRLAHMKRQDTQIEMNNLSVPIRLNRETLILREYLLQRIAQIKNPNNKTNNVILLETVFKVMKLEQGQYVRKQRMMEKIHTMLSYWKEKNYIDDFTVTEKKIMIESNSKTAAKKKRGVNC